LFVWGGCVGLGLLGELSMSLCFVFSLLVTLVKHSFCY
jgi:hypothetical protein